jgi:hypothetical protein
VLAAGLIALQFIFLSLSLFLNRRSFACSRCARSRFLKSHWEKKSYQSFTFVISPFSSSFHFPGFSLSIWHQSHRMSPEARKPISLYSPVVFHNEQHLISTFRSPCFQHMPNLFLILFTPLSRYHAHESMSPDFYFRHYYEAVSKIYLIPIHHITPFFKPLPSRQCNQF